MKVLFVCTGNTCRSPIAEAIFNSLNIDEKIFSESAGISIVPGSKVTKSSAELVYSELSIDIKNKEAKEIKTDMLKDSDLVLTMTEYVRDYIKTYFQEYKNKIFTLSEYVGVKEEIKDPYGGTVTVYKNIYDQIRESVSLLLLKIKEDVGI